jgi:glyoxylase-like metal-dependent hydrolase (beta-lactamase superfamily II)
VQEIAAGIWRLRGFPPDAINVYLVGDVLIDAGTRWARRRVLRQLAGRPLSLVALTHCHPDHQGVARLVCETRSVPLACHEADVEAMEGRLPVQRASPDHPLNRLIARYWEGPPHHVGQVLREGDEIAGMRVVHAPGHTPGSVIFFRDSDRVAIAGDVLNGMNVVTGVRGLHEPKSIFTLDPEENRRSIRKLAALNPAVVCFGHGPPLRDPAKLERFVRALPAA